MLSFAITGFAISQEIDVNTATVSVPEGGSTTTELQVMLTADPGGTLTVTADNISGDADIQPSPDPWTFDFNSGNWNVYQNVPLTAAEDADAVNGAATIRFSGSGVSNVDVTATETDNDTLAIQVNTATVSVPEGGSTTTELQVMLTADPGGTLTVTADNISGDADIQPSPDPWTFDFNSGNWNVYQNVPLTAAEDADVVNGSATIRFSGSGVSNVDVTATETDNDTLAIQVNTATVSVPEGGSTTTELQVMLTADPGGTLTVTADNISGDADIQPSPDPWTFDFNSGNWNVYQNVPLTAAEDADVVNGSATIRFSGSGVSNVDVTATETDNDTLAIQVNTATVSVPEGGSTTTELQVMLTADPGGTLTVTADNISGDVDIQPSPDPWTFGFNSGNWNVYQNVPLTAAEDADVVNGSATIRFSGSGVSNVDVTATETDNDTLAIQVNTATVSVPEGGSTTTELQVMLTADPGGTLTVTADNISGDVDIQPSPDPWTFGFNSGNWNVYQNVPLTAAEDADVVNGAATIRFSGSGVSNVDVTATEADNDTLAIQVNTATVSVPEGGSTTTELQVMLTADPGGTLTVTADNVLGDADIQSSPDPWTFGFNSGNWNVYQNVPLTAAEDADVVNGAATIRFSGSGVSNVDVTATEADNDTLAIQVNTATVSVPEGGSTTTELQVMLTADPGGTLTVTADNISGDADIQPSPDPWTFDFNSGNWNVYQNVPLTAAEDADVVNGAATIRFSGSGVSNVDVTATETDNDTLAFETNTTSVSVTEGGSTPANTLQVRLTAQPSSDVNASADNASGDTDIQPSPDPWTFTFNSTNWNQWQNVTLTAAEDVDVTNGTATVRFSASGLSNHDITATEADNDTLNFETNTLSVSVPEGGSTPANTLQVRLTAQPSSDVNASADNVSGDTDIQTNPDPWTFTFNSTNWNQWQNVTLTAAEDVDVTNGTATVRFSASGLSNHDITATEADNDTLNFETNTLSVSVPEGGSTPANTLQVRLTAQPSSNVNASADNASGDTDIQPSPDPWTFTFNSTNWNQWQNVTLTAAEDVDVANGTATIRFSASGLSDHDVTATENDNDTLAFETNTTSVSVTEGGSTPANTLRVRLTAQPSSDVNASADTASGDSDIQPSPDPWTFTFNATNWNQWQNVTLAAAEDVDVANGTATIRFSAAGLSNHDITATEVDDDSLNFQTRYTPVAITEGDTAQFEVRLSAQPSYNVNVTVSRVSGGDDDITVQSGANLVFTPVDWDDDQPVTLAAAEDDDDDNGTATIQISDNAGVISSINVTATEQDNDTSNGAISLLLNPSEAASGQDISVAVQIANYNQSVSNFGFDFIFDYNIFSFEGIQVGTLTSNWSITSQTVDQSRVRIEGSGGTVIPASSSGTLVTILIKVKCLTFTSAVQRTLRVESYTGDMSDAFSPEPCTSDFTYRPCSILGDVNGDGGVTPGDAQDAFEIFLGIQSPDMCQQMTSDANCSGSITPGDAQDIFEHFLGINTLPACCAEAQQTQQVTLTLQPFGPYPIDRMSIPEFRQLFPFNTTGRAGEIVSIPILITNPQGIGRFALDMNYPPEMLEYLGVRKSPMTEEFDYVTGSEEIQGLIHIMGTSMIPIESNHMGSLAVVVFRVKQGLPDRLPIILFNADQDILNAEIRQGSFARVDPELQEPGWIILGRAFHELDGTVRIPVRVSRVFDMRSFGMEFRFSEGNLHFVGIEHSDISQNFLAIQGYEVEEGFVRIGGYGMNPIQKKSPGILFELVFFSSGGEGEVELINLFDDLRNFEIRKTNTRIE